MTVYFPQVRSIPAAAANMRAAAAQPITFVPGPFTLSPITCGLLETSMMMTSSGGATSPAPAAVLLLLATA